MSKPDILAKEVQTFELRKKAKRLIILTIIAFSITLISILFYKISESHFSLEEMYKVAKPISFALNFIALLISVFCINKGLKLIKENRKPLIITIIILNGLLIIRFLFAYIIGYFLDM